MMRITKKLSLKYRFWIENALRIAISFAKIIIKINLEEENK